MQRKRNDDDKTGQVKIDFYTDPLCCWSWALEKHWRRILQEYIGIIEYRYIMCGMIPDWNSYNDPMNSVTKPIQMGPVWMHASEVTQVKMKYSIWHEDPPQSSYPACIAVKTVGLQSRDAEDQFLLEIRKAVMDDGRNIGKQNVLFSIAEQLPQDDFEFSTFKTDWEEQRGLDAFREDLKKARFHNIGRYPTLTLRQPNGKGILIVGYRPYEILKQAVDQIVIQCENQLNKE